MTSKKKAVKKKRPKSETRGDITIAEGSVIVGGKEIGRCDYKLKHGYHPAVRLSITVPGPYSRPLEKVEWFEMDTPKLMDAIFAKAEEMLMKAELDAAAERCHRNPSN